MDSHQNLEQDLERIGWNIHLALNGTPNNGLENSSNPLNFELDGNQNLINELEVPMESYSGGESGRGGKNELNGSSIEICGSLDNQSNHFLNGEQSTPREGNDLKKGLLLSFDNSFSQSPLKTLKSGSTQRALISQSPAQVIGEQVGKISSLESPHGLTEENSEDKDFFPITTSSLSISKERPSLTCHQHHHLSRPNLPSKSTLSSLNSELLHSNPPSNPFNSQWKQRGKHFFILSSSGKPIWSRYGDESQLSGLMAVIQALISVFDGQGDTLRYSFRQIVPWILFWIDPWLT